MEREEESKKEDRAELYSRKSRNAWAGKKGEMYIIRTERNSERRGLKRLLEIVDSGIALELGTGAGADTIYMLEKGWNVTAVDINSKSEKIIREKLKNVLSEEINQRLTFRNEAFEDLKLEKNKYDLVVGFDSLHFCGKNHFQTFFNNIVDSIKPGGYLIGNLLGVKDDWNKKETYMPFFTYEQVQKLIEKDFEYEGDDILCFEERFKEKGKEVSGKPKCWHGFFLRIRKK